MCFFKHWNIFEAYDFTEGLTWGIPVKHIHKLVYKLMNEHNIVNN